MYVEMEAMRDRPDLSMKTETKVFTKETKFIVARALETLVWLIIPYRCAPALQQ
jgi:hypothetical protein